MLQLHSNITTAVTAYLPQCSTPFLSLQ